MTLRERCAPPFKSRPFIFVIGAEMGSIITSLAWHWLT